MNWRDIASRAAWTFVQSFLSVLLAGEAGILDVALVRAAAVAGLAAVLSLIKTIAVQKLS